MKSRPEYDISLFMTETLLEGGKCGLKPGAETKGYAIGRERMSADGNVVRRSY